MGNMRFKVGDRVRIKSLDWYNKNKNHCGEIPLFKPSGLFVPDMSRYCNNIMTIKDICYGTYYRMKEDFWNYNWTDEMIEGLVEEETKPEPKFKVGDRVITNKGYIGKFEGWVSDYQVRVLFEESGDNVVIHPKELKLVEEETKPKDMGEVSDGYHTFNELYEYRMLYNAALFNEFAKQGLYDVHKSRKHSDGEYPFGDSNWFIVMAELPTGQISNHYEMKDWDKFQIPEKPVANKWDEHSPRDVANRLISFTTPKKEYPKTFEECVHVLEGENRMSLELMNTFRKLIDSRNAYWKIAGEEMGLGKPWEPDWKDGSLKYVILYDHNEICADTFNCTANRTLSFPTEEMRDAFYEAFRNEIEICKELL